MKLNNKNIIIIVSALLIIALAYYLIIVREIFKKKYSDICGDSEKILKLGDNNKAVKELQSLINQTSSIEISVDGFFDRNTQKVLKSITGKKEISLEGYAAFLYDKGIALSDVSINYCYSS